MQIDEEYFEYLAKPETAPESDKLVGLCHMLEQREEIEREIQFAERELENLQKKFKRLSNQDIPDLMEEIGIEELKLQNGKRVSVIEIIRANIPKDKNAEAIAWLRNHGNEALIKRNISFALGTRDTDLVNGIMSFLNDMGLDFVDKSDVHANTLSAFVKENLQSGIEMPEDLFGIYRQRTIKVK